MATPCKTELQARIRPGEIDLKLKALLPLSLLLTVLPLHAADPSNITRATLPNGLQVVIVHSALAPVVTVELNFKVGGDETPPGFPGSAHAEEHMAFRGCTGMTADQTAAIYAQLGGRDNADTQQNITQYFTTGAPSSRKYPATSPTPPTSSLIV
jgi:predicted Zn-dependent peptidase